MKMLPPGAVSPPHPSSIAAQDRRMVMMMGGIEVEAGRRWSPHHMVVDVLTACRMVMAMVVVLCSCWWCVPGVFLYCVPGCGCDSWCRAGAGGQGPGGGERGGGGGA